MWFLPCVIVCLKAISTVCDGAQNNLILSMQTWILQHKVPQKEKSISLCGVGYGGSRVALELSWSNQQTFLSSSLK